tara:strand:- start:888 stop:1139 length:252 start_codon:yes stop_codon:yes gene_type:complete
MRNVHRLFLPSLDQDGSGIIADTTYKLLDKKIIVTGFTIRVILDEKIGKDISNNLDKVTYYTILKYSQNEINEIYNEDGSKYK